MTGRPLLRNVACMMAVILWCFAISSTGQSNFRTPKWLLHVPDENLTGVPKTIVQLDNTFYYPFRLLMQSMLSSPRHQLNTYRTLQKTQKRFSKSNEFFCDTNGTRSATRPTSVHEVRPGDVDIVCSMGDSLTAGTGSLSTFLPHLFVDHRGISWASGGQGTWKEFLTLPNILKVFNPKLVGYAYGDSLSEQAYSQFNVAEPVAMSQDLPYMTKELVKRIKMDKRVNFNEDWKLVSIMIGANTYCQELCYEDYTTYAEKHRQELLKALLYMKENLPRTIVNIVLTPNLKILLTLTNLPPICFLTHRMGCPCLFAMQYKNRRSAYIDVMDKFQKVEKEIVEYEELKNKDDFTVIVQPFAEHLVYPKNHLNTTDLSYLSFDCFHFSQKGYARAANALWNNMMEPVGNKSTNWSKEFDRFNCPTDKSPYIRTWKNSIQ